MSVQCRNCKHAERKTFYKDWKQNVVWVCEKRVKKIPNASKNYCRGRLYHEAQNTAGSTAELFSLGFATEWVEEGVHR